MTVNNNKFVTKMKFDFKTARVLYLCENTCLS